MRVGVCWKWVSLDNEADPDRRWAGVSAADEAALEIALRLVDSDHDDEHCDPAHTDTAHVDTAGVTVVTLGPAPADSVLREAIAVGADSVVRIDASTELDSSTVATALAGHLRTCDVVICGDYSADRGTGSVPAFLADELGAAQALGLVSVETATTPAAGGTDGPAIRAVRRLDGGRREVLRVPTPAVLSVEGSVARLRRASLAASLSARSAPVDVVPGPHGRLPETEVHPYRPRARSLPAPTGDTLSRVRDLLDVTGGDERAEVVTLDPPDAARRIVEQLREWGYLHDDQATGALHGDAASNASTSG